MNKADKYLCLSAFFVLLLMVITACDSNQGDGLLTSEVNQDNRPLDTEKRPNILLIVLDDLGYTDLGIFGSEIQTPTIDSLANQGVLLTNFYASSVCSPTRSMLFSGTDNHLAGLGNMNEALAPNQRGRPGYEGHLNFRVVSLATLLRDANYHTYMSGKWHLGEEKVTSPRARGFDRSFALVHGGGGHFNDMGLDMDRKKAIYREDGNVVSLPADFYSTRSYTDKLIEYLSIPRNDGQPFFAYLAYTAPHWPLQAPEESIAMYKGKYNAGYDVIYERRLEQMKQRGLLDENVSVAPRLPGEPAWDELSASEKKIEARKMEIYAAMITDVDNNINRLLKFLEKANELDNTFIMFISDNGAEGAPLDDWPVFGDFMKECCDNSYENMGRPNSYVFYGQNWGRVSSGPFRMYKGFTSEGGIRVPAFVSYPGLILPGTKNHNFMTVMDIMPTFLELAETNHPGKEYLGRTVLPMRGKSLLPDINDENVATHGDDEWMGWEVFGKRAIRLADWKLVLMEEPHGNGDWELYNLQLDPGEQQNLASQHPEKLAEMIKLWEKYESDNGLIDAEGGIVF